MMLSTVAILPLHVMALWRGDDSELSQTQSIRIGPDRFDAHRLSAVAITVSSWPPGGAE